MAKTKNTADKPLTIKQKKFIHEYLKDMNGKEAAIRAGYGAGAAVTACRLLKLPQIEAAIEDKLKIADIQLGPILQVYKDILADENLASSAAGRAVQKSAADSLMRYTNQFRDRVEVQGSFTPIVNLTINKKKDGE